MHTADQYEDLGVREQVQRELNARVARRLVENAARAGTRYQMATLSAVNGRWGDVWKDVRRRRITIDHARSIVDSLLGARLIAPMVAKQKRLFISDYLTFRWDPTTNTIKQDKNTP